MTLSTSTLRTPANINVTARPLPNIGEARKPWSGRTTPLERTLAKMTQKTLCTRTGGTQKKKTGIKTALETAAMIAGATAFWWLFIELSWALRG